MAGKERKPRASRKSNKPTMAVVAEKAKVSVFTVSAVLNGTTSVSDARRLRVEEAIKAVGYQRNAVARSLKTGRTMTIGVVVGDITNPFYTDVVAVLQHELHGAGYAVMLCCNDHDIELQGEHVALLCDRMVDGLIVSPVGDDSHLQEALAGVDIPVVLVDRILKGRELDAVVLDNRAAVGDAVQYLLGLGHQRIGLVAGTADSYTGRERLAGYEAALREAGRPVEHELIQQGRIRVEDGYEAARRLLRLPKPPTAIFAANNLVLIGVMKAIHDLGLTCPADLSVVGLDDFAWTEAFTPQLTAVAQPVREFGERAARLLIDRLKDAPDRPARTIVLRGELNIRGSCRPVGRCAKPLQLA